MKRLLTLFICAFAVIVAVAYAAAPTATVDEVTATSIKLGSLQCGTHYNIRLRTRNPDGTFSATQTLNRTTSACTPPPPPPPSACADGLDNDSDGLTDYPADPGCTSASDADETDPVTGGTEPAPIAGQGYHEAFRDNFNTLDRSVWDDHIWYDDAPSPMWTGFQESDANGVLHLRSRSDWTYPGCSSNCWPINTVTTQTSGKTFTQGYFETRLKYDYAGDAAWPAFWLYSYRHATSPSYPRPNPVCAQMGLSDALCVAAELDVLDNGGWPSELYVGEHRDSGGYSAYPDSLRPPENWFDQGIRLGDDWHTYSMLWTGSTVTWYFDGQQVASVATFDTTNQPMFLLLQNWVGNDSRWGPGISGTTSDVQVDYVDVWQQ
jgi:beta-glucanase (GH16 family)